MTGQKDNWIVSYPDDGNAVCFGVEDGSFWYQHRNRCILNAVNASGFDKEFYDIGGGNGITAQALQNAGYDITLVEPYLQGIENARSRGILKTVHTTLEEFKPQNGRIKSVGFFDVMEHIEDDEAFLLSINKLLEKDGKLILTVPAFLSLWSYNDVQLGHFRRYRLEDIRKILSTCGFEVCYETYFFSLVWLPMWLARVLPNLLGIKKKNTPQKKKNEHMASNPWLSRILQHVLGWEKDIIRKQKKIPLGTSCMVVARKITD